MEEIDQVDEIELTAFPKNGKRPSETKTKIKSIAPLGWKMVDPLFLPQRGGGGGLWRLLPPNVDAVYAS